MNEYEIGQIQKSREFLVCKSNELVFSSRYRYTAGEQKAISYICSLIKPPDENGNFQLEYTFSISDFIKILGVDDGGMQYEIIKENLQAISDRSMWMKAKDENDGHTYEALVRWIAKPKIDKPEKGLVTVVLDEDLIYHLFDLKERFLQYGLCNVLFFHSKYSQHLYEILKAYYNLKRCQYHYDKTDTPIIDYEIGITELKHLFMLDTPEEKKKYNNFSDFRRFVIKAAQKDINKYSDISFDFDAVSKGRKVVKVIFHIKQKDVIERIKAADINSK